MAEKPSGGKEIEGGEFEIECGDITSTINFWPFWQ